ncbi:MAG: NlpC/P60 family protein [Thermovenabulum sp.]|uniref:C40 family peptidase n=1 Tax=Thermovenabulum sp. TaxID=3100335 RepID=UPI003C7D3E8A
MKYDNTLPAFSSEKLSELTIQTKKEVLNKIGLTEREVILDISVSLDKKNNLLFAGKTSDSNLKELYIKSFLKILGEENSKYVDNIAILPDKQLNDEIFAVVKYPVVNLGNAPHKAEGDDVVTQAKMGDILKIFEMKENWYFVQMEDNYLGWIDGNYIWRCNRDSLENYKKSKFVFVKAKMTDALGKDLKPLFDKKLVQGTVIPYIADEGNKISAIIPGGQKVYLNKEDVIVIKSREEVFNTKKDAESIIATAKQYLNLPYLWGGTTAYGFDCSGLTQFAFKMNGYNLRRDADMQFEQGIAIKDKKDLKPGDLVFFQTYKEGPSHVGIYIGNNKFIHAGSKSGISINSFDKNDPDYSEYLDQRFIGARRILP